MTPNTLRKGAHRTARSIIHGIIRGVCNSLKVDDPHFLGLPNSMSPGYGLLLILRVGVRVVYHDCVSSLQIEATPGCSDAQQEDEDIAVGRIEALDGSLPTRQQ